MSTKSTKKKKYKIARRLGAGVFEKTQGQKFMLSESRGQKMRKRRPRQSDYGLQLIEKQKVRYFYGIRERQFRNYVDKAIESGAKGMTPSIKLSELLEMRLDNTVYRMGLAETRGKARQLVSHGHITVNGDRSKVPSRALKKGDVISIREGSKDKTVFAEVDKKLKSHSAPAWINVDAKNATATIEGVPEEVDAFLNLQTVIEFYSR